MTDPLTAVSTGSRLPQLDGLRGLAAIIVVLHHTMLLSPGFADTYFTTDYAAPWTPMWLLSATPLKIFTAGGEAVTIFFVLSGLVLTLPVLRARSFDWMSYYPRRIVRLAVPTIASVIFAAAVVYIFPATQGVSYGGWVDLYDKAPPQVPQIVLASDLLFGDPYFNNPLWSLRWETVFSLLLPIFVGLALLLAKRPTIWIVSAAAIAGVGLLWHNDSMTHLPAFLAGAILAVSLSVWENRAQRLDASRWGPIIWPVLAGFAVLGLVSFWLLKPIADVSPWVFIATRFLIVLGAVVGVLVAAFWGPLARLLSGRVFQFLGVISFSIYLIHVPIAFAMIHVFGSGHWYLAALVTVVVALLLSIPFALFIERPSHKLSKRLGRLFSNRAQRLESEIRTERQPG